MQAEAPRETARNVFRDMRQRVRSMALVGLGAGALGNGSILMVHAWRNHAATPTLWAGVAAMILLGASAFWQRHAGEEGRMDIVLGYMLAVCTYFEVFGGMTAGTGLGHATFLMLCSMFYGSEGLATGLWSTLGALAIAGVASLWNIVPPWQASLWDPHEPLVWLRYAIVLGCYCASVAAAFAVLVDGLERSSRRMSDTLQRERWERVQREATQRALDTAKRLDAVGHAAAAMAEEFRTDLDAISVSAARIRSQQASAELTALADEIVVRTQRGADLAERLQSLRREPAPAEVMKLNAVVTQLLPALREALGERAQLQCEFSAHSAVAVDGARLQEALMYLADNARDAMPEGGSWSVEVTEQWLSTIPPGWSAQPGNFAVLSCTDNGAGMSLETQDRIFEPFFSTKQLGQGSGLGLASVRKVITDARGFVEVSSRPAGGATFRLYLPAQMEEHPLSSAPPAAAALESEPGDQPSSDSL